MQMKMHELSPPSWQMPNLTSCPTYKESWTLLTVTKCKQKFLLTESCSYTHVRAHFVTVSKVQLSLYVRQEVRFGICHDGGESSCIFICIHKIFVFQKRNVHIEIRFVVVTYWHEIFFDFHESCSYTHTHTHTHTDDFPPIHYLQQQEST